MKTCNTETLVLRTRPLGEADRLVTLFAWRKGKISAVARGARKTTSKLASGVDLFTYAHMALYRGKSLYTVTQVQAKQRFSTFHQDPFRYGYAFYFSELVDRYLVEGEGPEELGSLLLGSWRFLDGGGDARLLARFFELKLLSLSGYAPRLNECTGCLGKLQPEYFSLKTGGMLCADCGQQLKNLFKVSPGSISLANYLITCSFRELSRLRASRRQLAELKKINLSLLAYYLEIKECQSLKYMERWEKNTGVE